LNLTLSVDHRVADGAIAAQFLEKIAEIIENPYRLLWSPAKSAN
jgi:pyruvate dehydrogenase E2 component (dihydrolipoamide acetyltransferase)